MNNLLKNTLNLLTTRAVVIALAALAAAALAYWFFFRKKSPGSTGTTGGTLSEKIGGLLRVAGPQSGVIEGIAIPQHPGTADLFRVNLFPEFQMLDGEEWVWCSHLFNAETGAKILKRGFNKVETQEAMRTGTPTTRSQRFAILYLNAFNGIPFTMTNIGALKAAVDAYIGGQFGGAVDMVGYDPENDQETADYGQVVQELLLYARTRWGVRGVNFLGVAPFVGDWNVNNQPPNRTFFYPYVDDEATYEDVLPYVTNDHIRTGDWLYAYVRTTRNFRAVLPQKPVVSYWWHFTNDKTQYLPNYVCEAAPIFHWLAGGGTIINWEDGAKNLYIFAGDEYLMNGMLRLSRANPFRQGAVQFIVPEISTDGGASWRYNDEITAKANGDPMIGLTRNSAGYLLGGHPSRLAQGQQTVKVRADGFERTVTLTAQKTFLESIPV